MNHAGESGAIGSGTKAHGDNRASRPRVLHLIKSLAAIGGAEQLLASLAEASGPDGPFAYHVAHVLAGPDPDLVSELRASGVVVHDLGLASHFDLRWLLRFRRLLIDERIDIVHLHLPYAASLGRLVVHSLPRRPALVHTQHNVWQQNVPLVRALHRLTYRLDDVDIAVSEAVLSALPPSLRPRTEVLIHGLVFDELGDRDEVRQQVRSEFGIGDDELVVTTVANLRPGKGYEVLLEAARLLADAGVPLRIVAVGGGPLEEETRLLRAELGLERHVLLTGFRRDAKRIVYGSDLFILASHHEGFPIAVMEALALGVPVVATAVGDVPRVVHQGACGIIE